MKHDRYEYHQHREKADMNKYYALAETRARIKRENELRSLSTTVEGTTTLGDPSLKRLPKASGGLFKTLALIAIILIAAVIIGI